MASLIVLTFRLIYLGDETPLSDHYADGIGRAGRLTDATAKAEVVTEGIGDVRYHNAFFIQSLTNRYILYLFSFLVSLRYRVCFNQLPAQQ